MVALQVLRKADLRRGQNLNAKVVRQLVDSRADFFEASWHPVVAGRPLFLAIKISEVEWTDWIAVIPGTLCIFYDRIMAINSVPTAVVRDGECKHLSVNLVFTLYNTEEFGDSPHRKRHALSILAVRNLSPRAVTSHITNNTWS